MSKFKNSATPSASASAGPRRPVAGFATLTGCIVLGVVITIVLDGGKTDWIWLGCGFGAGIGAWIAQTAGFWPKKERK